MYHLTISAFIMHQKQLLLLHHRKLNTWIQVGGHVEHQEDPEMALWREIEEETGLQRQQLTLIEISKERPHYPAAISKALPLPFDVSVYISNYSEPHHHIELAYLIESTTNNICINIKESLDYGWFTLEQIHAMKDHLFPNVYAQCAFSLQKIEELA